ncbi:hypothetical protein B0A62_12205 [Flavobacterium hydatis]|uniref:Restriction endonuclease n=1 Tax=Flavobacterium hydatis TaxID=991 RepID=A0ABX4CGQ9_FLAHY|nr:hypothetical protein B0A62_12205 [Flavobacterium hydatis]
MLCFNIYTKNNQLFLNTSYCIGVDWLDDKSAIYIAPKLNSKSTKEEEKLIEVDYIKMLFSSLKYMETSNEINDLFEIKWNKPEIEIKQTQDLLTPLLVIQYLNLLKTIVRKGLKKSYYKVEHNLNSRVKGKILVGKNMKQNILKNKQLHTYCQYDEFGVNGLENRLLKKALVFVKKILPTLDKINHKNLASDLFNYITPAFETISKKVELNEIKHTKNNTFYKEYAEATRLAKLILKRFGYNISNVEKQTILTPPFWIDMSKLFEYYVLGLLKKQYPNQGEVKFQFNCNNAHEIDYLLNSEEIQMVIDAKYKPKYKYKSGIEKEDFRQISGYARLKKVYDEFKIEDYSKNIDCLVIYPDLETQHNDLSKLKAEENKIGKYVCFYKIGVNLPIIE